MFLNRKGIYSSGNTITKLIFYNQLKSESQASTEYDDWWLLEMGDSLIKDIPEDDSEKTFDLDDEGNLVLDDNAHIRVDF